MEVRPRTFLFFFLVTFFVCTLDFRNNACPNLFFYHFSRFGCSECYENPDVLSDVPSIVTRSGYNVVTHSLMTDDGYILTLFEISAQVTKNFTVFMQHGSKTNSGPWVGTRSKSLAFHLANEGYRVWLGNSRGTTYSNAHKNLTVHDPKYWDFNLDTMAEKDMLTQLNFIFETTGQKMHYIGHSMGTTLGLMFVSTFGEKANDWLQSITLFAPVVYLNDVSFMKFMKFPGELLNKMLNFFGVNGIFYEENFNHRFLNIFCKLLPEVCYAYMNLVSGVTKNFASEDLLLYFSFWPTGTSLGQLDQYMQFTESERFQKFDYGAAENLMEYGTEEPPAYNLTNVILPVAMFYGKNDPLYTEDNLERLYNELGSSKKYEYSISCEGDRYYNHIDFVYSKCRAEELYPVLDSFMQDQEREDL